MNCRIGRSYARPAVDTAGLPVMAADVSRNAAGSLGTLSNWTPRRLAWREEGRQREAIALRANDIAVNDAHGASLIDSITINTVGTGLWPRSTPNYKRLGITEEQAAELAESAEWEFEQFAKEADARGVTDFYGIQFQNIWSLLVKGEFVNLPLMLKDPARRYGLALQTVDPLRLRTPLSLVGSKNVRDGIRLGEHGQPVGYFLANPDDGKITASLDISQYRELPPKRGHRPVVLHRFFAKEPEQVRGVSILAPVMKFVKDKADYLDFEIVGAIVAKSFPVWIEKQNAYDATTGLGVKTVQNADATTTHYRELTPGMVHYGNTGEKPHFPQSDPGASFASFLETVLRGIGAACGMPYEIIAKDFSKTNYSSARAALEEAWRVFTLYQDWLVNHFCQVIWEMVFEEAWLRGRLILPAGAPDFYSARAEYCACDWTVPDRTTLDPVKEMVAHVMGKQNNASTDADFAAKRGKDWEKIYEQRARERKKAKGLELPEVNDPTVSKKAQTPDDPLEPSAASSMSAIIAEAIREEIRAAVTAQEQTHGQ